MLKYYGKPEYINYLTGVGIECERQLQKIGIKHGEILFYGEHQSIEWGKCEKITDGYYIITINGLLVKNKYRKALEETIFHEILHTCTGCYNHGEEWKRLCGIVENRLGIKISTYDSYIDKGVDLNDFMNYNSYKYAISCKKCGITYFRKKKSLFVKNYGKYRCGACGGELYATFN